MSRLEPRYEIRQHYAETSPPGRGGPAGQANARGAARDLVDCRPGAGPRSCSSASASTSSSLNGSAGGVVSVTEVVTKRSQRGKSKAGAAGKDGAAAAGAHASSESSAQCGAGDGSLSGSGTDTPVTVESLVERLEATMLAWEKYGHEMLDKPSSALSSFITEVQTGFVRGSRAKADAMVNYLESTSIGHELKDMELMEKMAHGISYLETSIEESRLSRAVQTALASACDRLLTIDEIPEPWRENPYIVRGYRFSADPWDCVKSIFDVHNETTNIWTHLAGAIMFVGLALFHLPNTESWTQGTWIDRAPMIVFVLAALKCLLCSVTWHSFCSISDICTKRRMACVDYTGITICICASILTTEYSVLNCHPLAQAFYMTITLLTGGVGIMLNWHPRFDTTGARPMRALFFCCFAVFGGLGGVHAMFYRGIAETLTYYTPVLKSLACYGTGVLFYATLFPERIFTGMFDYCGMSHNIWHGFVVAGIYYHYRAMIEIFETAVKEVCPI